jgi:DNA-binding HxlR family transcriptional regulator
MSKHTTQKTICIEHNPDLCPVVKSAEILGDVWVLLLLRDLEKGEKRYSDLLNSIHGITTATCSKRLKMLEQNDIVHRSVIHTTPVQIRYSLTEKGRDTKKIIDSLRFFGKKHLI